MAKKIDYASLYTLRKDGRYCKQLPGGRYIYDRDPYQLYLKEQEALRPKLNTFKEVAEDWEAEYRERIADNTWKNYARHFFELVAAFGDKEVKCITAQDVTRDLQKLAAQGMSRTVVNGRRVIWNGIFNYALAQGYIPYNPAASLRLPKTVKGEGRRATTKAEDAIICKNIDQEFGMFPFFLLCTGLRRSEALALNCSDIDFAAGVIHVTKTLANVHSSHSGFKPPKTAAGVRDVPIIAVLEQPLKDYIRKLRGNVLFPAIDLKRKDHPYIYDRYMIENNFRACWSHYCEAVGLWDAEEKKPTITPHCLRHSAATMMFEDNVDEYTAQRILGHANINITREIYTELRKEQEKKSQKRFGRSLSKLTKA